MRILLSAIALLPALLIADAIPSGWTVLKERTGACQIGAPGDFKPDSMSPSLAKGPGDAMEVQIYSSTSPVKPLNETVAKVMGIEKMFENTDKRIFYALKQAKVMDGRMITAWRVTVPRTGGSCFATITLTPAGSEDLARKIAATIGPAK
jgi:hypothetical protein